MAVHTDVWPGGRPEVGDIAQRSRSIALGDIELFAQISGDTITGRVEITDVRTDKPITKVVATVTRDDGMVAVDGEALCYTMPLAPTPS